MSGETEQQVSGWTVDTLREHVSARIAADRAFFVQRFDDAETLLNERYRSQEIAMRTALDAAEKAVSAALSAAETAVAKAEAASEKRFESVNEFRAQLSDQAGTFMSRKEADVRLSSLSDKLDSETSRNAARIGELELRLTSRLDRAGGEVVGAATHRSESRLDMGTLIQVVSVIIAFAAIAIVIFKK